MGFFKKVGKFIKKHTKQAWEYGTFQKDPFKGADKFIRNELGGYGNVLMTAGIIAAGIATGGALSAAGAGTMAGAGTAAGAATAGAATATGLSSYAASAAIAAGVATGVASGVSGAEARKEEIEAHKQAAKEKKAVAKANALEEEQRRASLFALRRQVGATNVGKSAIFGSGSANTMSGNDVLGIKLG